MTDTSISARAIYQDLLDRIGAARDANDFDTYATYFCLPHLVQSFDRRAHITSREQLQKLFNDLQQELQVHNITTMARLCTGANFVDERTITGGHTVWVVNRENKLHDSYISLTTVRLGPDGWQVGDSQYAGSEGCVLDTVTSKMKPGPDVASNPSAEERS